MTAVKKKLLIALAFVAMLFAGIALLSACSGNEDDLKVTFMVQEDGGEWGSYREADIVDGSVEMPENPTKLYYNFSNWYYTQDGTGDPFENSGITESVTVKGWNSAAGTPTRTLRKAPNGTESPSLPRCMPAL